MNGWRAAAYFGDSDFYDGNWLLRAVAAETDFFGSDPAEAVLLTARDDGNGEIGKPYRQFEPVRQLPCDEQLDLCCV